ncbi:MAG: histidinol-phosphate transaminase [Clostridiales bacterium]|nr:histidinol-phosphate transaminase [Clostridiales bacterium]
MSRFMGARYSLFDAYTPGEQPQDRQYIKLNTNESPYPPSPKVRQALDAGEIEDQRLYPDPECTALRAKLAQVYDLQPDQLLCGNGSDELLSFAFMAWGSRGAAFADVSYGLYRVLADLHQVKAHIVPLREGFVLDDRDYLGLNRLIVIANPNAPTGLALKPRQLALIAEQNPDGVVLVDEAYVDFGAESCLPLVGRYDNLCVVQTFSKSRSLAGARLGFAAGPAELMRDLKKIKNAINPYNVSRLTQRGGIASLEDADYFLLNTRAIMQTRENTARSLTAMGFEVLPSRTNFLFARHPGIGGAALYMALKKRGVLVRHFGAERTKDYVRITVGSQEQMAALLDGVRAIMGGIRA